MIPWVRSAIDCSAEDHSALVTLESHRGASEYHTINIAYALANHEIFRIIV